MTDNYRTENDAMREAVLAGVNAQLLDGNGVWNAVTPNDATREVIDLERVFPAPRRQSGTTLAYTVDSFNALVSDHFSTTGKPGITVWFDRRAGTSGLGMFRAVIGDSFGEPTWRDYRVEFSLLTDPAWEAWQARAGSFMSQTDFAELVEDRLSEIREPDGATMLEVAQSMEVTTSAYFSSANRLRDGQTQLVYREEMDSAAGPAGSIDVPDKFVIQVPIFRGGPTTSVTCRFRYRVVEGKLRVSYRIVEPDRIVQAEQDLFVATVRDYCVRLAVPMYEGWRPAHPALGS